MTVQLELDILFTSSLTLVDTMCQRNTVCHEETSASASGQKQGQEQQPTTTKPVGPYGGPRIQLEMEIESVTKKMNSN